MCFVTQALTSPATLVTIKKQSATRFQARRKSLSLSCSAVCGADLPPQLEYGSRGAYYMSEGDEPYVPVTFESIGDAPLTKERFLQLLGRSASTNIDETDWASWAIEMVNRHLTDVKVFDVGFEDNGDGVRPLYIIGKTSCGELAGYKTIIVAT